MAVLRTPIAVKDREPDGRDPVGRLSRLMDPQSMLRLHVADDSGVTAVRGRILGCKALAYCTDAATMGGALGAAGCRHIVAAIELAVRERCPIVGLWHSGGARLADGVESLDSVGQMFAAMTRASGQIPQISLILGPAAGAAAYGPALTDLVIMSAAARMFVTGPDIVRAVTGEQVDMEALGGPMAHSEKSGTAHVIATSEDAAYGKARLLVELLARPGIIDLHRVEKEKDLRHLLPKVSKRAYDVRPLVREILDTDDGRPAFEELQPRWAPNVVVGLGRLAGHTTGVVANNPLRKGGCLDALSADKAARFVRMCDCLGVPLIVLVDVPGYLPGTDQEWGGVIRRGAKLLHAFAESTVPRVTLITRKSYGGAYIAMNSRSLGATAVYAWPDADLAVMGAEAAVEILHRKKLAAVRSPDQQKSLKSRLAAEHVDVSGGIKRAVSLGLVDEVIDPQYSRYRLAEALAAAVAGRGQHGNIPL